MEHVPRIFWLVCSNCTHTDTTHPSDVCICDHQNNTETWTAHRHKLKHIYKHIYYIKTNTLKTTKHRKPYPYIWFVRTLNGWMRWHTIKQNIHISIMYAPSITNNRFNIKRIKNKKTLRYITRSNTWSVVFIRLVSSSTSMGGNSDYLI